MNAAPLSPVPAAAAELREPLRRQLAQYLAWLDDPGTHPALRCFARAAAGSALEYLADERTLTDVMAVLCRAVIRGDKLPLALLYDLPLKLSDGRDVCVGAERRLGDSALRAGAIEPLIEITRAALLRRRVVVPAAWICAIMHAEVGPEPRDTVVEILHDWLGRDESDPVQVDRILSERPFLHATLFVDYLPFEDAPAGDISRNLDPAGNP